MTDIKLVDCVRYKLYPYDPKIPAIEGSDPPPSFSSGHLKTLCNECICSKRICSSWFYKCLTCTLRKPKTVCNKERCC